MSRPNLIYIVCHDLGRQLGCYGREVETPHLDAFAGKALKFTRAYCTSPACSPSRACAMTGLYPHQSGVTGLAHLGFSLPSGVRTIADELRDAGYLTAHIGLQHERVAPSENRYEVETHRTHADTFTENAVERALEFLASPRADGRPFYLNIGLLETHPQRWGEPFADDRLRHYEPFMPPDASPPPYAADTPAAREAARRFAGSIRFMDHHLGRLFRGMEKLDTFADSLVIFTTDHGAAFGPRSKGSLYTPGLEIALLARMPGGGRAGETEDALIGNIDLMPTLLEAAGAPVPARCEGRSFLPLLEGKEQTQNEILFFQRNFHGSHTSARYSDPVRGCMTRGHLFLRHLANPDPPGPLADNPPPTPETAADQGAVPWRRKRAIDELFDLGNDPFSAADIIGLAEGPRLACRLAGRLVEWMKKTGDPAAHRPLPDLLAEQGRAETGP